MEIKKAVQLMLISTLAFAFMNGLVKYLIHFNTYQLVFFRSAGSLFFTMGYLLYRKIPILGNKRQLLLLRAVVGASSMLLFFSSLKYLPVGSAISLRYMAPIFAAIFAVLLLKEKVKPIQWLFFAIAFTGVLVLKQFDAQINTTGFFLIFCSAILVGMVYVLINKIGKADHPIVIINYFMVVSAIAGGVLAIPYWVTPSGIEWLLLLSMGAVGFLGQLFMTKAFQATATNIAAPLKYTEVPFTVLLGYFWLGELYSYWSLLGILLIACGIILNTLYKSRQKKQQSE